MDYLDPEKKKKHQTRLFIGYGLMAIAVAIATVILVYIGSGYYLDSQTGDLIQNGQILVNSDPEGAQVFLDGKVQRSKTASKLVVPSGSYTIDIKKDGYRDWTQSLKLEGGRVQRLDYARLIPSVLQTTAAQTFSAAPVQLSQSIDRRFIGMIFADKPQSVVVYDLTKPDRAPVSVAIDAGSLSDPKKVGTLQINEWTDDGKYMLIANKFENAITDYLVVSRDLGEAPVNLTTKYGLGDAVFSLRERTNDKFFVYSPSAKTMGIIEGSDKQVTPKLKDVIQFSGYDANTIVYATSTGASKGKTQIRLLDGDKNYLMREVTVADTYLLATAKQGSSIIVGFGVSSENKISIIKNPSGYLRANPDKAIPLATTVFLIDAPTELAFSSDSSVVMARGGQKIASHYFEEDKTSIFDVPVALGAEKLNWSDGKHLQLISGVEAYTVDFDGGNLQKLGPTVASLGSYYDNNYRSLYTFSAGAKFFSINRTLMHVNE